MHCKCVSACSWEKLLLGCHCSSFNKDIGQASLSGSCWRRGLWVCGCLGPSAPLPPVCGSTDPGFSFLLGKPRWNSFSLELDLSSAADTRTDSLHAHTPPPSLRLRQNTDRGSLVQYFCSSFTHSCLHQTDVQKHC